MKFLISLVFLTLVASTLASSVKDNGRSLAAVTLVTSFLKTISFAKLLKFASTALATKPLVFFLGAIYVVTFLLGFIFPSVPAILGLRSLDHFAEIVDVSSYSHYLDGYDIANKTFDVFDIKQPICRQRTACELGQYVANKFVTVAKTLKIISKLLPAAYADAIILGTKSTDCAAVFNDCPFSPLAKFVHFPKLF